LSVPLNFTKSVPTNQTTIEQLRDSFELNRKPQCTNEVYKKALDATS